MNNPRRDIMFNMQQPERSENEMVRHIREAANNEKQNDLLVIVREATKHPESLVAKYLEVEGLRIEANGFYSKTKGALGQMNEIKPGLTSETPKTELTDYETELKDYLVAHNRSTDTIIDRKISNPLEATSNVLKRLALSLENQNGKGSNKNFMMKSLSNTGTREVAPQQLREAISSTSAAVTENIWEVIQTGRNTAFEIMDVALTDMVREHYADVTNESFIRASDWATQAIKELAE